LKSELDDLRVQRKLEREKKRRDERQRTLAERSADFVNRGLGSWKFLIAQTAVIVIWVILNTIALIQHWDPYPFLLMNICLSLQAAYAAPLIQLSQNRAQDRDAILQEFLREETEKEFEQNEKILKLLAELRTEIVKDGRRTDGQRARAKPKATA
jgi:uncharacterized membrane protein